jgi:hypothetical protein
MVRFKAHLVGGAVAWLWLLILAVGPAGASPFRIDLVGAPVAVPGGFQWNYALELLGAERTQSGPNTPTPDLIASRPDFFIIYDFLGYVPGSIVAPAGWSAAAPLFTAPADRPEQQEGVFDDPTIANLVFTKTAGAPDPQFGPIIAGFSAISLFGGQAFGVGSAEITANEPGNITDNTNIVGTQTVAVPVPEPSTALLLLAGPLFVFGAVRRGLRRRQA